MQRRSIWILCYGEVQEYPSVQRRTGMMDMRNVDFFNQSLVFNHCQCCHRPVHGMDPWGVHPGSGQMVHTIGKKWGGPWGPWQCPLYVQFVCNCLPSTGKNHFFNSHLLAWHLVTGGGTTSIKKTRILGPIRTLLN